MDKKKTASKTAKTTKGGTAKAVKLKDIDLKPDKVKGGGGTKQEQTHK